MSLYEQLFPLEHGDFPNVFAWLYNVLPFWAAIGDYVAGETTANQIKIGFELNTQSQAELDVLLAHVDGLSGLDEKMAWMMQFQAVCMLSVGGYKYLDQASFKTRLGI